MNSSNSIGDMQDNFDDCDDIDGNDDEFNALGSILSWDEAEETQRNQIDLSNSMPTTYMASYGSSLPPDTVQFSTNKDGATQLDFFQNKINPGVFQIQRATQARHTSNQTTDERQQQLVSNGSTDTNMTLQLPLPTPVGSLTQEPQEDLMNNCENQQQHSTLSQSNAFAQLLAKLQQPDHQQASTNSGQTGQQQLSQQQQQQFPYSTDPNQLFRQLQFAQLQQQLQVAQNQSQPSQQQTQLAASPAQQQVQNAIQQQLQVRFAQSAGGNVSTQSAQQGSPLLASIPRSRDAFPASVSNKPLGQNTPVSSKSSIPLASLAVKANAMGTVSASDTDGDFSLQVKSSRKASSSHDESKKKVKLDLRASRDRNREHARNTRLRKKVYLEKLKSTVDELCRERDMLVSERTGAANLLLEMHNTRTEVLMSFFALRTSNEKKRKLWASIIDESCFACVLPVTPYRSFPASEVQVSKCLRTILGIDGVMADTASLHVLLASLVDRSSFPDGKIILRYTLVTEEAVVAGNQMMARWVMTTINAVQLGAKVEVCKQGMLCCKFNSAHKIIGLELMFDVMAFMLQLKQAAGSDGFTVIPNNVQTCQRSFDKPMVITLAEPPYTIIQVNNLWEDMTGYSADEVVGKLACSILQLPDLDKQPVKDLMQEVRFKRPASSMLVNKTKSGDIFLNYLVVYPLSTDSRITYYLGLTTFAKKEKATPIQAPLRETYNSSMSWAPSASSNGTTNLPKMTMELGQMPPPSNVPQQSQPHSFGGV